MDKINIQNLFPSNKFSDKPLDVHTLYNPRDNKIEQELNMNIDRLINLREERRMKLGREYERIFKMCMTKIHIANNLNRVDIIYQVPVAVGLFPEYSTSECLQHLDKRLKESNFESDILDTIHIYISWKNIGNRNKR